jgi:predicted SnoaL-like aldol condensation-catalyzing enzyme
MRSATYPLWFFERLRSCVLHADWAALADLVAGDPMMSSMRPSVDALVRGATVRRETLDSNRALVLKYFDMWNRGAGALADEVLGATFRDHAHPSVLGPAALRSLVPRFRAKYPDMHMVVEILAAVGDLVVALNDLRGMPGPDQSVTRGLSFFRVAEGKLAEHWIGYAG